MSETKEPKIKLFGKTIQLPNTPPPLPPPPLPPAPEASNEVGRAQSSEYLPCSTDSFQEESNLDKGGEEEESKKELSDANVIPLKNEYSNAKKSNSEEEEESETNNSNDKTLKKPNKIVPCPRCNSMDTKFCYFNNYNVNQPRHFCKNCQRYWTAGGTMRNVPVGAGRRKNKNSTTHYRQLNVPEALQVGGADLPHPTILTFGSDTPLCESMASALNIVENSLRDGTGNSKNEVRVRGLGLPEIVVPSGPNFPQVPYFPPGPWGYPWNAVPWSPQAPPPPPGFCPPGFPMPFYPPVPYWGAVPWIGPHNHGPPTSPTLGKHSRAAAAGDEEEGPEKEKCLWVPKTLRIDDPGEAAKSSIWATLGIKNDKSDRVNGGGLFKTFESKAEENTRRSETSPVLQANPAALSRSLNFRESS